MSGKSKPKRKPLTATQKAKVMERYYAKYKYTIARKRQEMRQRVINKLGGMCACCKEERLEFLCIDHADGGGNKHRKTITPNSLYRLLDAGNKLGVKFRILCHNCNFSIGVYGYCPHQENKK